MNELSGAANLIEKTNEGTSSILINNIADDIFKSVGLKYDKFVYAATIYWLRIKLKSDVILPGEKYFVLAENSTMEDLFQIVGSEIPSNEFSKIDVNLPRVDLCGIYYDENGNFLKTEGTEAELESVYIKASTNNSDFVASLEDFELLVAALYGEASGLSKENLEEMEAIGDAIINRKNITGSTLRNIITAPQQIKGYNPESVKSTETGRKNSDNIKLNKARKASISTFLGFTKGKSNKAYFWDGKDISITDENNKLYNPHRDAGIYYTNSNHDIYKTGNLLNAPITRYYILENGKQGGSRGTYTHMYDSTAAFGGTVFWKKTLIL